MATTITIVCPECEKPMKAPEAILGKKIRCKACGHTFAAKAAGGKPAGKPAAKAAKKKGDEEDEPAGAYGVTEEYLGPRCPECANAMEEGDIICLFCGYNTVTRTKPRFRKVREITGLDVFLHLLPGILCALAIVAMITLFVIYCATISEATFGDAWYDFIGGKAIKMWTGVIVTGLCWLAGKFAVRRLIFDYWPPEIEEKIVK